MPKQPATAPATGAYTAIKVLSKAAFSPKGGVPLIYTIGGIRCATSAPVNAEDAEKMNQTLSILEAAQ